MSTAPRVAIHAFARSMGTMGPKPSQFRGIHSTAKAGRSATLGSESRATASKEGRFSNVLVPRGPGKAQTTSGFSTGGERNATHVNLPTAGDFGMRSAEGPSIRIPFLPDNFNPYREPEPVHVVSKPIIYTVADASTHITPPSALTEMIDNTSINVSFNIFSSPTSTLSAAPDEQSLGAIFKDVLSTNKA